MASLGHNEVKEIVQIYTESRAQVSINFPYRFKQTPPPIWPAEHVYYISSIWMCFFGWVEPGFPPLMEPSKADIYTRCTRTPVPNIFRSQTNRSGPLFTKQEDVLPPNLVKKWKRLNSNLAATRLHEILR